MIEKALKTKNIAMKEFTHQRKLQLSQNILPNGHSILHVLASSKDARLATMNKICTDMFEISEHSVNMYLEKIDESVKFEIPMLRDLNMQTALDICLDVEKEDTGPPEMCP